MCQHKQCAYEAKYALASVSKRIEIYFTSICRKDYYIIVQHISQLIDYDLVNATLELASVVL